MHLSVVDFAASGEVHWVGLIMSNGIVSFFSHHVWEFSQYAPSFAPLVQNLSPILATAKRTRLIMKKSCDILHKIFTRPLPLQTRTVVCIFHDRQRHIVLQTVDTCLVKAYLKIFILWCTIYFSFLWWLPFAIQRNKRVHTCQFYYQLAVSWLNLTRRSGLSLIMTLYFDYAIR